MTTREDQVRAARLLTERNPEWRWGDPILVHTSCGVSPHDALARLLFDGGSMGPYVSLINGRWFAVDRDGVKVKTFDNRLRIFPTPAAACRALGFDIREE